MCKESNKAKIIAVSGKGGVGKTSLSALLVRLLVKQFPDARVLAIDADPAVGLATALGVDVTYTVDDIRKKFIDNVEGGQNKAAIELLNDARFELMDTIVEKDGFAFMAIGRPETAGCYCKVNSFLKDMISVLSGEFDYVVIDGEAGVEQINRRVMEKVTHLLLVSDASKKGTQVIQTIADVAKGLCMYQKIGAVINRVRDESIKEYITTGDIPILAYLPEDDDLAKLDIQGKSLLELSESSKTLLGLYNAMQKIELL